MYIQTSIIRHLSKRNCYNRSAYFIHRSMRINCVAIFINLYYLLHYRHLFIVISLSSISLWPLLLIVSSTLLLTFIIYYVMRHHLFVIIHFIIIVITFVYFVVCNLLHLLLSFFFGKLDVSLLCLRGLVLSLPLPFSSLSPFRSAYAPLLQCSLAPSRSRFRSVLSKHFRPDRRGISAGRKIYAPAK